jgi:cephalosporin hydroxylase
MTRNRRPAARELAHRALELGADQKLAELSSLISFLKRRVLRTVVEIGTRKGGTFFVWCQIAEPDALVASIDLPGGPFGGGYKETKIPRFQGYAQPDQHLHFLRLDSHDPATRQDLREILSGREIDFLMIDGDHTYDGVHQDFEFYSPFVKDRGLVAFHDIVHHDQVPECQVELFWNEVKIRYRNREFVSTGEDRGWGNWGGIGVLYYERQRRRSLGG